MFFLTDGEPNPGGEAPAELLDQVAERGIEFHAVQITGTAVSAPLQFMADTIDAHADSTGTAQLVSDPNGLSATLFAAADTAVTSVQVNGQPAALLDEAGEFYAAVRIEPGDNPLTVEAFAENGVRRAVTLTLIGTPAEPELDFTRLQDVTALGGLTYSGTTYNRQTRTLHARAELPALDAPLQSEPLVAVFAPIAPPSVQLANPAGFTPAGEPYVRRSTALRSRANALATSSSNPLGSGDPSYELLGSGDPSYELLSFTNPDQLRFTFDVTLLAQENTPPFFSSIPNLSAAIGSTYQYTATATDPDGDALTYALRIAPSGMTIDAAQGVLTWTPAADQSGTHRVQLEATDGRGGTALQTFTIRIPQSPDQQHTPVITSIPPRIASVGTDYRYAVTVADPRDTQFTFELLQAPASLTIDPDSGLVHGTPTSDDPGTPLIEIRATDPDGNVALQAYRLNVRPANTPPQFPPAAEIEIQAGSVFRYRAQATDPDDAVRYELDPGPPGMQIDPLLGLVTWPTTPADVGAYDLLVRATDDRGLSATQAIKLSVVPDQTPPSVALELSRTVAQPGDLIQLRVSASDATPIAAYRLQIDGQDVPLDANRSASFTVAAPGLLDVVATAIDASGNAGTAVRQIRVIDPTDTTPPLVRITSPASGATVTYLTEILGTVTDPNLEFYRLQYALAGTDEWHTFHSQVDSPVLDGLLGVFDPTLLANDLYDLRVEAQDLSGNIWREPLQLNVAGRAKLGQFTLDFTDLTVPLAGIPIQIHRTYDTLLAGQSGDFGFGWQLTVAAANLRESVRVTPAERSGVPAAFSAAPFRTGTRVYLTNPSGQRVGFTFDPLPEGGLLGTIWHPRFTPDPGVYETLSVDDVPLEQQADGTFRLYLFGLPYNPSEYTLATFPPRPAAVPAGRVPAARIPRWPVAASNRIVAASLRRRA